MRISTRSTVVKRLDFDMFAKLIDAGHVLQPKVTDARVVRNVKNLASLLGFLRHLKDLREKDGNNASVETNEYAALRWALRVVTHPKVQALAVGELYDGNGNLLDKYADDWEQT